MADERVRRQVALLAARLMYERQESEYFTAKRKAARQLGVEYKFRPGDLPSNLASKLIEGFTERHLFFHPAVVTLDDFVRDVDSLVAIKNLRAF